MTEQATEQPAVDLRAYGSAFHADPYPVYAELRERGPVHRVITPEGDTGWLVVGHDEVRAALAAPTLSKDWTKSADDWVPDDEQGELVRHMLNSDAPRHTRLRRLVAKEFTPRRIEALRPRVQQLTDELLDAMAASPSGGHADLVEALAFPLPIAVICELLGVPFMDREPFREWSNTLITPHGDAEREQAAVTAMAGYLSQMVEHKRRAPGDDLMSALIRTTDEDGDRLSPQELTSMAFLLLVAGHETTVNLITNGVLGLLTHPEQLAALRADVTLVDNAVEEMLRWDGPVEGATARFTTQPYEVGGTEIPGGGELVILSLAAADRDPNRYPDPNRFDIRRQAGGHVAFGHGIHFCLGAPLARMEGQIAIRSLLNRFPDLALDTAPSTPDWRPGLLIRGVRRLAVRWTPQG
ncbi:cytochrome P450 family protein [Streptantibioticus ferralitis]|uniref:Cytochrome P450 n=1 Tax=Streptantibioticus ferralitis TaxID=236510 RepID=A0ABT5Z492_9ACTN|nr:cytochrome P450 [Streptantibioticus ferralitis]MDF2258618.1 cytochrome P450 [Streptantibioticus ferralitis]